MKNVSRILIFKVLIYLAQLIKVQTRERTEKQEKRETEYKL